MSETPEDVKAELLWALRRWKDTQTPEELVVTLLDAPSVRSILADRETRGEPKQRMFCTSCGSGIHDGQCDCTKMQRPAPVVAEPVAYTTRQAIADLSEPGVCAISASLMKSGVYPVAIYASPPSDAERIRPYVSVSEYAGITEMHIEDCPTVTGAEMIVRPLRKMEDREQIVGFQWVTGSEGDNPAERIRQLEADKAELAEGLGKLMEAMHTAEIALACIPIGISVGGARNDTHVKISEAQDGLRNARHTAFPLAKHADALKRENGNV